MAKNRRILPYLAWGEYEEEKALENAEESADIYDDELYSDDYWYDDEYNDGYPEEDTNWQVEACWAEHKVLSIDYWEDQDDLMDDYWYYLCGSYSSSYLEIWENLEAEEKSWDMFEAEVLADEEELKSLSMEMTPTSMRAMRRHMAYCHKQRILRNATVAAKAFRKRNIEDMNTGYRCKRRGGHEVKMPKSLGFRSMKVCKRARKLHVA